MWVEQSTNLNEKRITSRFHKKIINETYNCMVNYSMDAVLW